MLLIRKQTTGETQEGNHIGGKTAKGGNIIEDTSGEKTPNKTGNKQKK